ncbi:hypothetical protein CsSME_00051637 [Camellia sinensis var. sinensis]
MFIQRKDSSGKWNLCFRRSRFGWEHKGHRNDCIFNGH